MSGAPGSTALLWAAVRSAAGRDGQENHDRGIADPVRGLLLVADGMGGLPMATASAERAAAVVADFLDAGSDGRALGDAVQAAGSAVANMGRTAGVERTGTTLCVGLIHLDRLWVANLGDSRCYLMRNGVATVLTVDHTPAARLIAEGTIEAGSPAAADLSRSLDRYLGRGDSAPDLESHEVRPGDRLLFCTDGVHRALSHDTLASLLAGGGRPAETAEQLVEEARRAGGTDDATAVVADIGLRPAVVLSLSSAVGGGLLGAGEVATVGRAGEGADIGFDDSAVHGRAASLSVGESGWILENTGSRLVVVVRDRRSAMSVEVPCLRRLAVPFAEAEVVLTTRHGEHSFTADCPPLAGAGVVVPSVSDSGTDASYQFDKSTAQFRTLVAICESRLRGRRRGRRLSEKDVVKRLRPTEPAVTLKAVSRRIDELSDKILGRGARDIQGLAERAVMTGTVTWDDLKLLEKPRDEREQDRTQPPVGPGDD